MKTLKIGMILGGLLLLGSCTVGAFPKMPVLPPTGVVFMGVKAPLALETPMDMTKTKSGSVEAMYLHIPFLPGLSFAWGDASIGGAAKNGHLSKVDHAEAEIFQVLGIFSKVTVTAYGD